MKRRINWQTLKNLLQPLKWETYDFSPLKKEKGLKDENVPKVAD